MSLPLAPPYEGGAVRPSGRGGHFAFDFLLMQSPCLRRNVSRAGRPKSPLQVSRIAHKVPISCKNDIKNLKFPDHFILISRSKQVIFNIMSSKFNDALELIESLTLEEQEELLEIERKRISERKRKLLLEEISDAEKDIANGNYLTGTPEELVKAIEEESKNL
jgi:hypothetical protein